MPILRAELTAFASTHNAHRIRAQRNRLQHISGVFKELYRFGLQHGFNVDRKVLAVMQQTLSAYDFDAYLTIETMHWCEQQMQSLNIVTPPVASDFLLQRREVIPNWYRPLLFQIRAHVAAGLESLLQLAPRFDDESGALTATRQRLQLLQQRGYDPSVSDGMNLNHLNGSRELELEP
jgi:hypothetical protein